MSEIPLGQRICCGRLDDGGCGGVGDIKPSFSGAPETGWIFLDDGTIGDQYSGAISRANPDTWPLYSYLWPSGGMYVFQPGTWTPVGKGASAAADFNAHRHLSLPRVCGRAMAAAGQGRSVDATKYPGGAPGTPNLSFAWWTDFNGAESVVLNGNQIPGHYHSFGVPDHGHPYCIDTTGQNSLNTHGAGGFPTSNGGANQARGPYTGWPTGNDDNTMIGGGGGFAGNTGWAGNNEAHTNIGPRFYCHLLCKL